MKYKRWRFKEKEILGEIHKYVDQTYDAHYVGDDNVQAFDLINAAGHGIGFTVGNIIKYGSRYGKKNGLNRKDLLKIIHYAIMALYVHDKEEKKRKNESPTTTTKTRNKNKH